MKPSGFFKRVKPLRQRRREGADVEREVKPWAVALASSTVRSLHKGTMEGGTSGVPVTKGPAAKPGKGAQTKDEAAWVAALLEYGCICCRQLGFGYVAPEIHHILRGGVRLGHKFTLPLCTNHHRGGARFASRHPWRERFEQAYGTEMGLLSTLQGVLKLQADGSYAP